MRYEMDYVIAAAIVIVVGLSLLGLGETLKTGEEKIKERRNSVRLLIYGLGGLVLAAVGNGLTEERWDVSFLLAFLLARKTGDWLFRALLPFCYVAISCGLQGLFMSRKGFSG